MAADNGTSESISKNINTVLDKLDKVSQKNSSLIKELEAIEGKANEKSSTELIQALKEHLKTAKDNNTQLQETLQSQSAALKEDYDKINKKNDSNKQGPNDWQTRSGEQELSYQLKEQVSKNVEMQNSKLKTELALYERIEALKLMGQTNKKLQADVNTSRGNTQKLLKLFDKRAKEAEKRLSEMEEELKRSQEVSQRYQELYEAERRKAQTKTSADTPRTERSTESVGDDQVENSNEKQDGSKGEKADKRATSAKNKTSASYSDLQRKYQILIDDNDRLKDEVKRLRYENGDLYKRAKEAGSCLQILKSQVATSFTDREQLQKQLRKQKQEQHKLERSMTKQANDWIECKRQQQRHEEEYRWSQIGPISVVGAEKRAYANPVTKQEDTPRDIPVEQWAINN